MRTVLLLVIAALLGGCSAIRTVYNQAEHVAVWRADDYFDLTDEQKRLFREHFARLHAWHRATQLRNYAGLLEGAHRRLVQGPAMQDVSWLVDGVRDHSQVLVGRAYRDAATLLATLSDEQIAHARKRFERDNRKFAREHGVGAAAAEQKRLRAKRHIEAIEHWSGALDSEQRARITALSEALPLDAALRQQDRLRRQREFLALLEQRHDARFPDRLREWMIDWNAKRPAELDAQLDAYDHAHRRMLMTALEQLRPDQQRKVGERLRWYVDVMRDLARDASHQQADLSALPPQARP